MTTAASFIRPSSLSAVGGVLDDCAVAEMAYAAAPLLLKTAIRIGFVAKVWIYAVADLISWVGATVTVWYAWQTGFWNHAVSLTSTVAACILSLGIPLGYCPKTQFLRPHCLIGWGESHVTIASFEKLMLQPQTIRTTNAEALIARHLESPRGIEMLQWVLRDMQQDWDLTDLFQMLIPCFVKVCLDKNRGDLVVWLRNNLRHRAKQAFAEFDIASQKVFVLLGENLNFLDANGRTVFMYAVGSSDASNELDRLFTCSRQVDPRLGLPPIDVNVKTPEGFDALSLTLAGLRPGLAGTDLQSRYYYLLGEEERQQNPENLRRRNQYLGLIHYLLDKGAFIEDWRFEDYRDFLQRCLDTADRQIENPYEKHKSHNNCYIRAFAHTGSMAWGHDINSNNPLQPTIITSVVQRFLTHAEQLVQYKPTLLEKWEPHRVRYLQQYKQFVSIGFLHHTQEGFFTNPKTGNGATLIAEYLMGEAPITGSAT